MTQKKKNEVGGFPLSLGPLPHHGRFLNRTLVFKRGGRLCYTDPT